MNKLLAVILLSSIVSSVAMAKTEVPGEMLDLDALIAQAHAQGYAVAQCRYGVCRDADNKGRYVSISNADRDGYYVYDPRSAEAPEDFTVTQSDN